MKFKSTQTPFLAQWIYSWKLVLIALPFMIFIPGIQHTMPGQTYLYWKWSLASTIGVLPTAILYFVFKILYFQKYKSQTVPMWTVFAFGLSVGAAKGLGTGVSSMYLGLLDSSPTREILFRVINSSLIGLVLVPTIAIVAQSFSNFSVSRRNLIDKYLTMEYSTLENRNLIIELKSQLSKKVDSNIREILKDTKLKLDSSKKLDSEWEQIAKILRETALSTVRPLSHELWKYSHKKVQFDFFQYLHLIARTIRFNRFWVLALYILTTFQMLELNGSPRLAIINLSLRTLFLFILLSLAGISLELMNTDRNKFFIPALVLLIILDFLFKWLINELTGYTTSIYSISDSIWIAILIIVIGTVQSFLNTQLYEIQQLEVLTRKIQLSEVATRNEVARFSRDIAKYLHGTLQSRLMASAMSIENAAKLGSSKDLDRQIQKAIDSLEMPPFDYLNISTRETEGGYTKLIDKWDGLIQTTINGTNLYKTLDSKTCQNVLDVIDEGLANAFRHGDSTIASVSLYLNTDNKLEIEIIDNGNGPSQGFDGMGSQLFSSVSKNWSLNAAKKGTGSILIVEFDQDNLAITKKPS